MKSIQLVLFDLGNVLVRFTPESFWQVLGLDTTERAPFIEGVTKASSRFESGKINTKGFFDELEQVFQARFRREQLRRAVASVLTDPIPGMEAIVSQATQRVTTALVSNTNEFHYEYCMKAIPAMKMLPKHYLSYKLGVMKPDLRFYEKVLDDAKVDAKRAVFVDDIAENIEGARAVGMQGLLFSNPQDLISYLRKQGVLSP